MSRFINLYSIFLRKLGTPTLVIVVIACVGAVTFGVAGLIKAPMVVEVSNDIVKTATGVDLEAAELKIKQGK